MKYRVRDILRSRGYEYDPSSKISGHPVDGVATAYGYDGAGRLVSESRPGYAASYSLDGNGNRLSRVVNGVAEGYAYADGDKLLTVSSGNGRRGA